MITARPVPLHGRIHRLKPAEAAWPPFVEYIAEGDRPDVAGPSSISRVASLRLAHSTFGRSTVCGYIRISVTPRAVLNRFPILGDATPDARELSFGTCRAMLPDL